LLYLEPNIWCGKPELADNSGLVNGSRRKSAKVLFVYPGSLATKAGIVAGDELKDSSGRDLTGEQWHDLLDAVPGSYVCVTVIHESFTLMSYL
jgi:predicted metalloprotease with PDZ domain